MSESVDARFERAKQLFIEGLGLFEAGRFDAAERCFLDSLGLLPGRVSTLINLAATQLKLGRPRDALATAAQVLAIEPDNLDAGFHRANALAQLDRAEEALAGYERLLSLDPTLAPVWSRRGGLLREMNRLDEAAEAFERAIALGADAQLNGYYLASVRGGSAPTTAPRSYVTSLFDEYAGQFDQHLLQVLQYRAHEVLLRQLQRLAPGPYASALDLGCGTGLCGPLVRPMVGTLAGVDLSEQMLARARALGVYDELVHGDIVEHLNRTPQRPELVLAADVFIYVGELTQVFAGVQRVMPRGGVFCFTAERAPDADDFVLRPSLRYAHSARYLRTLAAQHGFDVIDVVHAPVREDQHDSIEGLFVYLKRQ
ncbi:MAG TPA: tetratricopeptide repeat protein [Albitalea sp.]